VRIHVLEVGRLRFPQGWFECRSRAEIRRAVTRSLVRGPSDEIPILSYVVEHDDGHIVVDTGLNRTAIAGVLSNPVVGRILGATVESEEEVGPQMRARGLRPEDVRWVLPTHLDMDHAGGVGHFPNAECLVHREEWDTLRTVLGKFRCQPKLWPEWFAPKVYELRSEPFGSFDRSLPLTDQRDIVAVPTPGHSKGHVGIVIKHDGTHLFFGGDHLIRQNWFASDLRKGIEPLNFYQRLTMQTTRRIRSYVEQFRTILLPSHDAEAASNLAANTPLVI
jgi:glyoxylase-like metal-dependent hydrolase (beta-lactamase superfamily II)